MIRAARIILSAILLAALPLRGYAGVLLAPCEGHHGGAATAQEHVHEHGDGHSHESSDDGISDSSPAASVCSVCATCCSGAGLVAQLIQEIVFQPPGNVRIPFVGSQASVFVPEHLERPPLAF